MSQDPILKSLKGYKNDPSQEAFLGSELVRMTIEGIKQVEQSVEQQLRYGKMTDVPIAVAVDHCELPNGEDCRIVVLVNIYPRERDRDFLSSVEPAIKQIFERGDAST